MATIITSHRTTVAMTNSIHALLSEDHPWTLLMVSLHPTNQIHCRVYGLMTEPPMEGCGILVTAASQVWLLSG
jgi:hypothetical protein